MAGPRVGIVGEQLAQVHVGQTRRGGPTRLRHSSVPRRSTTASCRPSSDRLHRRSGPPGAPASDCRHRHRTLWRKFTNDYRPITERSRAVHLPLLLSTGMAEHRRPHVRVPGGSRRSDAGVRTRCRPGVVDPTASHGIPAIAGPAGQAVQQRCDRPRPPSRRHGGGLHAVPEGQGAPMTLTFREVERQSLPDEEAPVILIIDDDHLTRDSLAATLSIEGFDVLTAATGDEGVALLVLRIAVTRHPRHPDRRLRGLRRLPPHHLGRPVAPRSS